MPDQRRSSARIRTQVVQETTSGRKKRVNRSSNADASNVKSSLEALYTPLNIVKNTTTTTTNTAKTSRKAETSKQDKIMSKSRAKERSIKKRKLAEDVSLVKKKKTSSSTIPTSKESTATNEATKVSFDSNNSKADADEDSDYLDDNEDNDNGGDNEDNNNDDNNVSKSRFSARSVKSRRLPMTATASADDDEDEDVNTATMHASDEADTAQVAAAKKASSSSSSSRSKRAKTSVTQSNKKKSSSSTTTPVGKVSTTTTRESTTKESTATNEATKVSFDSNNSKADADDDSDYLDDNDDKDNGGDNEDNNNDDNNVSKARSSARSVKSRRLPMTATASADDDEDEDVNTATMHASDEADTAQVAAAKKASSSSSSRSKRAKTRSNASQKAKRSDKRNGKKSFGNLIKVNITNIKILNRKVFISNKLSSINSTTAIYKRPLSPVSASRDVERDENEEMSDDSDTKHCGETNDKEVYLPKGLLTSIEHDMEDYMEEDDISSGTKLGATALEAGNDVAETVRSNHVIDAIRSIPALIRTQDNQREEMGPRFVSTSSMRRMRVYKSTASSSILVDFTKNTARTRRKRSNATYNIDALKHVCDFLSNWVENTSLEEVDIYENTKSWNDDVLFYLRKYGITRDHYNSDFVHMFDEYVRFHYSSKCYRGIRRCLESNRIVLNMELRNLLRSIGDIKHTAEHQKEVSNLAEKAAADYPDESRGRSRLTRQDVFEAPKPGIYASSPTETWKDNDEEGIDILHDAVQEVMQELNL